MTSTSPPPLYETAAGSFDSPPPKSFIKKVSLQGRIFPSKMTDFRRNRKNSRPLAEFLIGGRPYGGRGVAALQREGQALVKKI